MTTISAVVLRDFSAGLLAAAGFNASQADEMADLLVWANLRGVDSHGVLRIPRYIEMLQTGEVRADSEISDVHRFGAVCMLDAGGAPGATAMNRAVEEAATLAASFGLGWCGVRKTSHAGALRSFVPEVSR